MSSTAFSASRKLSELYSLTSEANGVFVLAGYTMWSLKERLGGEVK